MATPTLVTHVPVPLTNAGHDEKIAGVEVHQVNETKVSKEFVRTAVYQADVSALRIALCHAVDDQELEAMHVRKVDILGGAQVDYALSPEDQEKVRQKAIAYLLSGPHSPPPKPSKDDASRLMDLFSDVPMKSNSKMSFDYNEGYEELAFDDYPREVSWSNGIPSPDTLNHWKVAIIGAGISGIAAAIPLKKLGISFEMIERQAAFGGTWLQNNYPNVRVDNPGYLFQYSFTKGYKWKEFFPAGGNIRNYMQEVANDYGLLEHAQFNQEVIAARWDEPTSKWTLTTKHKDGSERNIVCNAIISASGLFSTPRLPDIKGIESFSRPMFHTSRWDHSVDYKGKRIAVIGTGSTGTQLAPALAETAEHLSVYQRTANWIVPFDLFRMPVSDNVHWIIDNMPFYWNWYCYSIFFKSLNFAGIQYFDTEWMAKGGLVSERNDKVRKALTDYIQNSFSNRPDLVAKMVPTHAPGVRRRVVDNGFYKTVQRPNVDLIIETIDCITETGIRTKDGEHREYDMIALGAGFSVMQYFFPVDYVGRDGMTLQKSWEKDGARSYLGMCMPHYPNLFTLYGPNHQPRSGSLHSFAEKWARYAVSAVVGMIEQGKQSMEIKAEIFEDYNTRLDAATQKLIWEFQGSGYYVNKHGRQNVNMPWTNAEYHPMIQRPNFDEFHLR